MEADETTVALTRNVLALTTGLPLWTAGHFGVLAVLRLFLYDRGRRSWPPLVAAAAVPLLGAAAYLAHARRLADRP